MIDHIDNDKKKYLQQNGKVDLKESANKPFSAKRQVAVIDWIMKNIKNLTKWTDSNYQIRLC